MDSVFQKESLRTLQTASKPPPQAADLLFLGKIEDSPGSIRL